MADWKNTDRLRENHDYYIYAQTSVHLLQDLAEIST